MKLPYSQARYTGPVRVLHRHHPNTPKPQPASDAPPASRYWTSPAPKWAERRRPKPSASGHRYPSAALASKRSGSKKPLFWVPARSGERPGFSKKKHQGTVRALSGLVGGAPAPCPGLLGIRSEATCMYWHQRSLPRFFVFEPLGSNVGLGPELIEDGPEPVNLRSAHFLAGARYSCRCFRHPPRATSGELRVAWYTAPHFIPLTSKPSFL